MAIDREAEIPDSVVRGLGWLGVLGACLPKEFGGGGFSQASYCRMIEVLGRPLRAARPCSSTPIIRSARGRWCCSARPSSKPAICPSWPAANGSAPLP